MERSMRTIAIALALAASIFATTVVAPAPAYAAGEPRIFGDSTSTPSTASGASSAANSWAGLTTGAEYNAVSGYKADTLSNLVRLQTVDSRDVFLMIGTNDVHIHGNSVQEQAWYKEFLRASTAWLVTPTKKFARPAGNFTYTGTWGNTQVNTFGKYTDGVGASVTGTFTGDSVYVFYIIQQSASAIADVEIDGVNVGTLNSDGTIGSDSMNANWSHAAHRFTGFGAGSHTIKITSRGGVRFYFDGIADTVQTGGALLKIGNIAYFSSAYYTSKGLTQATTDAYNAIVSDVYNELDADGFDVELVDINSEISPTTDLKPDGVHWLDSGHLKVYNAFN